MRWGQFTGITAVMLGVAIGFQGCGTVGALSNLVNNVIGTASNAAGKTLNTAGNTASKALTPSTYADLAKKSRRQPRSYTPPSTAPRTSARNHDAQNNSSNSTRKGKSNNASSYFRGKARR